MIVKIIPASGSDFHGVQYNDKKMEKGEKGVECKPKAAGVGKIDQHRGNQTVARTLPSRAAQNGGVAWMGVRAGSLSIHGA